MKNPHRTIIALIVVVVGLVAIFWYGNTWRVEWDVASGEQRTVKKFLGIPRYGEPEETRLSEWRGERSGEPAWVRVGSSAPPGVLAQSCYFKLLSSDLNFISVQLELSATDGDLDTREAKQEVVRFILDALRNGAGICAVKNALLHSTVFDLKRDLTASPITISELRALSFGKEAQQE